MPGHRHPDPGCHFFNFLKDHRITMMQHIFDNQFLAEFSVIGFISSPSYEYVHIRPIGFVEIHNFSDPCFSAVNSFEDLLCAKADNAAIPF